MALLNKHFWKFFAGLLGILAVGFLVIYGANFYTYWKAERAAKSAQKEIHRLQKLYEEDTYGGKTPEETLALFIDALKKGDTDLAAKYFAPEDIEKSKNDLNEAKVANTLNQIIVRLSLLTKSKVESNEVSFIIPDKRGVVKYQILLGKNSNGVWKILDL